MNIRLTNKGNGCLANALLIVFVIMSFSAIALAEQEINTKSVTENANVVLDTNYIVLSILAVVSALEAMIIVLLALKIYKGRHQKVLLEEEKETLKNKIENRDSEIQHANRELQKEIKARKDHEEENKQLAVADPLTGALNRSIFLERGEKEFSRSQRYARELSVLVLDMDNFKQINQKYGYKVGDEALKALSDTCKNALRETDLFGRIGDEEFSAVLPETGIKLANEVAERLRLSLSMIAVGNGEKRSRCTASIGVTTMTETDTKLETMVNKADAALQQAKKSGKNRVVIG